MSQPRNTTAEPSRSRHIARVVTAVGTALVTLAACNDAPSAPSAAPLQPVAMQHAKGPGSAGTTTPAVRVDPLGRPITVRYRIDPNKNGKIEIKDAGLEIDVPKGAVASPVEITVTALPGNVVAYEFQPHGLVFRRPLQARQDLKAIGMKQAGKKGSLIGGILSTLDIPLLEVSYFADMGALHGNGPVHVLEFLASVTNLATNRVEFDIHHFSGYMVSWGRSRAAQN